MNAYLKYAPHVILSEYFSKKEYDTNIVFQNFIRSQEKLAECRKLPFRHFLILPVTRLQRYVLLLGAVVKKTPDGHSDKRDIQKCIDIVKNVASASDEKTLQTKNTLRIYEINDRLRYKLINGEQCNLDLVKPGRKLWLEGVLGKKQHLDQVGMQVFLFDHVLLITKIKKVSSGKDVEYHVTKQPIPLELLHLQEATEGFSIGVRTMSSTANGTNGGTMMSSNSQDSTLVNMPLTTGGSYPLVFQHLGRQGTEHMLYAENSQVRLSWKENIVMAKAQLENLYPEKRVFEIRSLSDTTFAGSNSSSASSSIHNHGKVICTVPFMGATGIRMVAIGTQHGVWMGIEGDTNTISLVLTINDVNQIAVLEDHNIFLVLSGKVYLIWL
jgi:hypothetical protein